MGQMEQGLQNLDVKSIRDAASKAKSIGQMLAPEAAVRIQLAIDAARDVREGRSSRLANRLRSRSICVRSAR